MKTGFGLAALAATLVFGAPTMSFAQGGGGQGMAERFQALDADGDGRLSADEAAEWRETVFVTMDADDDGRLTREEYMAVQFGQGADPEQRGPRFEERQAEKDAAFTAMDEEGDGFVTREQFLAAGARNFSEADADGDGYVTLPEFIAARWMM